MADPVIIKYLFLCTTIFTLSLAIIGLALSLLFRKGCEATARNNEAYNNLFTLTLIGGAFIELVMLVVATMFFILISKI